MWLPLIAVRHLASNVICFCVEQPIELSCDIFICFVSILFSKRSITIYIYIYITDSNPQVTEAIVGNHDGVIKWKHFPRYWPFCAGNSPVTGEFPAQRPVTGSFDVFCHLCLNKRLSKQSWGLWLETPSRLLWRHCNGWLIQSNEHYSTHWSGCIKGRHFTEHIFQTNFTQRKLLYLVLNFTEIHFKCPIDNTHALDQHNWSDEKPLAEPMMA